MEDSEVRTDEPKTNVQDFKGSLVELSQEMSKALLQGLRHPPNGIVRASFLEQARQFLKDNSISADTMQAAQHGLGQMAGENITFPFPVGGEAEEA